MRCLVFLILLVIAPAAWAAQSAVLVMYHRFGEAAFPSTSIRLDQFEAHIKLLKEGGYAVLPLPEIVSALAEKRPLPEKAVAITMDDAYVSIYRQAWPRLKAAGFPFTLFVATGDIDAGLKDHMSWEQIREFAQAGVTIGAHSVSHPHMPDLTPAQIEREFAHSNRRFQEELGKVPDLVAYPYGETSLSIIEAAKKAGYRAGFGQHSGVAWNGGDPFYIPRYPFNEKYGEPERVKRNLETLPLPVVNLSPADYTQAKPPMTYRFEVEPSAGDISRLACYTADGLPAPTRIEDRAVEARLTKPFGKGRNRLNCTLPAPGGRFRWFGVQYYVPG
jgi:peptidoglycan/xylan/chitin deacetylase (PgdA/CDA1 family)